MNVMAGPASTAPVRKAGPALTIWWQSEDLSPAERIFTATVSVPFDHLQVRPALREGFGRL